MFCRANALRVEPRRNLASYVTPGEAAGTLGTRPRFAMWMVREMTVSLIRQRRKLPPEPKFTELTMFDDA